MRFARAAAQEGVTQRGTCSFCGSVAFLAPEILLRKGPPAGWMDWEGNPHAEAMNSQAKPCRLCFLGSFIFPFQGPFARVLAGSSVFVCFSSLLWSLGKPSGGSGRGRGRGRGDASERFMLARCSFT